MEIVVPSSSPKAAGCRPSSCKVSTCHSDRLQVQHLTLLFFSIKNVRCIDWAVSTIQELALQGLTAGSAKFTTHSSSAAASSSPQGMSQLRAIADQLPELPRARSPYLCLHGDAEEALTQHLELAYRQGSCISTGRHRIKISLSDRKNARSFWRSDLPCPHQPLLAQECLSLAESIRH